MNDEMGCFQATPAIHGVLGQTYREDHKKRAKWFKSHNSGEVIVDSASGSGFLDGAVADYISTGVLEADCKYAQYRSSRELPLINSQ